MLTNYKFVIPNGVREVRNPSFRSLRERSIPGRRMPWN